MASGAAHDAAVRRMDALVDSGNRHSNPYLESALEAIVSSSGSKDSFHFNRNGDMEEGENYGVKPVQPVHPGKYHHHHQHHQNKNKNNNNSGSRNNSSIRNSSRSSSRGSGEDSEEMDPLMRGIAIPGRKRGNCDDDDDEDEDEHEDDCNHTQKPTSRASYGSSLDDHHHHHHHGGLHQGSITFSTSTSINTAAANVHSAVDTSLDLKQGPSQFSLNHDTNEIQNTSESQNRSHSDGIGSHLDKRPPTVAGVSSAVQELLYLDILRKLRAVEDEERRARIALLRDGWYIAGCPATGAQNGGRYGSEFDYLPSVHDGAQAEHIPRVFNPAARRLWFTYNLPIIERHMLLLCQRYADSLFKEYVEKSTERITLPFIRSLISMYCTGEGGVECDNDGDGSYEVHVDGEEWQEEQMRTFTFSPRVALECRERAAIVREEAESRAAIRYRRHSLHTQESAEDLWLEAVEETSYIYSDFLDGLEWLQFVECFERTRWSLALEEASVRRTSQFEQIARRLREVSHEEYRWKQLTRDVHHIVERERCGRVCIMQSQRMRFEILMDNGFRRVERKCRRSKKDWMLMIPGSVLTEPTPANSNEPVISSSRKGKVNTRLTGDVYARITFLEQGERHRIHLLECAFRNDVRVAHRDTTLALEDEMRERRDLFIMRCLQMVEMKGRLLIMEDESIGRHRLLVQLSQWMQLLGDELREQKRVRQLKRREKNRPPPLRQLLPSNGAASQPARRASQQSRAARGFSLQIPNPAAPRGGTSQPAWLVKAKVPVPGRGQGSKDATTRGTTATATTGGVAAAVAAGQPSPFFTFPSFNDSNGGRPWIP